MRLLVDTPVWSLMVRRSTGTESPREAAALRMLRESAAEGEAVLIGPVRQEVLSGLAGDVHYRRVREALRAFRDEPLTTADFEVGALNYNLCRARGIQGTLVDFLLCAVSFRLAVPILTLDADFGRYSREIDVKVVGLAD